MLQHWQKSVNSETPPRHRSRQSQQKYPDVPYVFSRTLKTDNTEGCSGHCPRCHQKTMAWPNVSILTTNGPGQGCPLCARSHKAIGGKVRVDKGKGVFVRKNLVTGRGNPGIGHPGIRYLRSPNGARHRDRCSDTSVISVFV